MKTYTQEHVDALPLVKGVRHCRLGNYVDCKFDSHCKFPSGCTFDSHCKFASGCTFGSGCKVLESACDATSLVS